MSASPRAVPDKWSAGPAANLAWAEFDDAFIVYHRPSGKTHFLNSATMQLLTRVLTSPHTASTAAERLAADQDAVGDEAFFAAVAESLRYLEHLGLVERSDG
jgi:PqqD family protein of HPr-rel-A system